MANNTAAMTPAQAAQVLQGIGGHEETLTARATGVTNMIWGMVAASIFLAYAAADGLDGFRWFSTLLWAPFVAAGMLLTRRVWATHAVVLRVRHEGKPSMSLLFSFGFAAVAVGLIFGLPAIGIEWSTHAIMLLVNGLLAIVMGAFAKTVWCSCGGKETATAGVLMLAGGVALGILGLGEAATGLAAALVALACWFGSGLAIYARG